MDVPAPLLRVADVRKTFSGVLAVDDVCLEVPQGSLVGVLGPNGAGKSTLFHIIAGHLRPDRGHVFFDGVDITRLRSHERAAAGLGLVFQTPRLFAGMTVLDNVMSGEFLRGSAGMVASALRLPSHRRTESLAEARAHEQIHQLGISGLENAEVSSLPFGLQRRVAVAQALGVGHRLLLLDEPAAGLTGFERGALRDVIAGLRVSGISLLLVEHDVRFVAGIADSLVVLDRGAVLAAGPVDEVLTDPAVMQAYSGVSA